MQKKIENTKNAPEVQTGEKSDVARREEEILSFWVEHDIFKKSIERPGGVDFIEGSVETDAGASKDFVFYDGPPFATGTPHYGHILAGTIKDAIPRFQTMNGKRVVRKWGWDCHGLPLENIIEKRLGLSTKRDIEEMGVKQFNEAARSAVMEYEQDWKEVVPRMGRFVDMEDDYKTMDASYTESVWWIFSELNKKGLVYEGFKSMHLCPRCGTTLSNFEVNQGYKDIKDIAVTVKMPLLDAEGNVTNTAILIWTTTPWTLPGNMAIAIHRDVEYVKLKMRVDVTEGDALQGEVDEYVIVARERVSQIGTDVYEIVEEMKGEALIGKKYLPPFETFKNQECKNKENAWKIYHADYVSTEDGTGAVHIAPAYGEEDMELAKRENIPLLHHVDADGRFKSIVTEFGGQLVKPKDDDKTGVSHVDADVEVVKYLKGKQVLVRKENISHSYPHCWRCDTPLLNYATTSWFVRVTDIKDTLVEENSKVRWVPEHVGTNRFGKWLEGARDWAVSRQRYWGAPLPVWKHPVTGACTIIGSEEELTKHIPRSENQYFLMRHGESLSNLNGVSSTVFGEQNPLTEKGREQVVESAEKLKDVGINLIIASPFERTMETAEMVREILGMSPDQLITDNRLCEIGLGELDGISIVQYHEYLHTQSHWSTATPSGGESWSDVKRRVGDFLYDIESRYQKKKILIVSHNSPLRMLSAVAHGQVLRSLDFDHDEEGKRYKNAEVQHLPFVRLPHNDAYELDYHRPYIDEVEVCDEQGERLVRVPDVFDCWFESGAMPYAQHHYPFEHGDDFLQRKFPAQFIAEGLDQTRGWFYSLIVLSTALFGKAPFENVIVNGLTLAEDGKKMSKSLQNYPDPMELTHRVGADALRYYLLSSPVVRGEDLRVSEKEILEQQRKNLGRLHNVLAMYELYVDENVVSSIESTHILDMWILARLNETTQVVTSGYQSYELDKATRPIEGLIDDISVWYLRRSRERLKSEDSSDKELTLSTLRYVLKQLALLMAPVMPFYAEYLFQRVREKDDAESVHLMAWPKDREVDSVVCGEMSIVREFVTLALEARTRANIKVRQPLSELRTSVELGAPYAKIVADEINVKAVVYDPSLIDRISLNTVITPELKQEGNVRELTRAIQEARKEMGLKQENSITLSIDGKTKELIARAEADVLRTVGARGARVDEALATHTLVIEGVEYHFGIQVT